MIDKDQILIASHITKQFGGVKALDDVSVEIQRGEVHCLVGENGSGKSTFIKIVAGAIPYDEGKLYLNGTYYPRIQPHMSIKEGVQVIYQDLSLFNHLTVAENIVINKQIWENRRFVDWKQIYQTAQEQLDSIGVSMDLNATIQETSVANRQLVAICRALSLDMKLLFMDEPTTALSQNEVDRLLTIVEDLKRAGKTIVFVSHKLDEVFSVADRITVFRDGKKAGAFDGKHLDKKLLVYCMTGRDVEYPMYRQNNIQPKTVLSVRHLNHKKHFHDISFDLCEGDILGLFGLLGSGRTEIALSLFGLNAPESGTIIIDGKKVDIDSPSKAVDMGIALLPEERQTQGMFANNSIKDNIASTMLDRIKNKVGFVPEDRKEDLACESIKKLRIRTESPEKMASALSGGNQQKTVLGKWMVTMPKIFILDSPTKGVDIGSKAEIYEQIQDFAKKGMAVIVISDEIEEITANCNRVLIMHKGRIIERFEAEDLEKIDLYSAFQRAVNDDKAKEATLTGGDAV